ncbi:MAG: hypothetical protein ACE5FN_12030, partial [Leptospirillia bacterium]
MAIAFDAATGIADKEANSLTWAHTCAGTDRILLVFAGANDAGGPGTPVSSVTYGGAALSLLWAVEDAGNGARTEVWYQVNPAAGTTDVVVTWAGNPKFLAAGSQSFTGVDQTTPIDAHGGTAGTASPITANLLPVTDGAMVADGAHFWKAGAVTPEAGQTLAFDVFQSDGREAGSYKLVPTAGQTSTSWTHDGGSAAVWAVALRPATATGVISGAGGAAASVGVLGAGSAAGPVAISGSGVVSGSLSVAGAGSVAVPGSTGTGAAGMTVGAAGSGSSAPPSPVSGSGVTGVTIGIDGAGTATPPGVSGVGAVAAVVTSSGAGAAQGPAPVSGSGGVAGQVAVAGNGQAVPPGVSGTGIVVVGVAMAGSGTVVVPPSVTGAG